MLSIFAGIEKKGTTKKKGKKGKSSAISKFTTGLSLRGVAAPVAKKQREFAKLF